MEQTFVIEGRPELSFDGQGDAAQEAEFLHAETGRQHRVLFDGEVVYESQGAPDDEDRIILPDDMNTGERR